MRELTIEEEKNVSGGVTPWMIVAGVIGTWALYEYGDEFVEGFLDAMKA